VKKDQQSMQIETERLINLLLLALLLSFVFLPWHAKKWDMAMVILLPD